MNRIFEQELTEETEQSIHSPCYLCFLLFKPLNPKH